MLPPRAEMEKLEDDILKQVNTPQLFELLNSWDDCSSCLKLLLVTHVSRSVCASSTATGYQRLSGS
jgi:hypothetical protein